MSVVVRQLNFTVTTTSQKILDRAISRPYFLIQNKGSQIIYLGIDGPATTAGMAIYPTGNGEPYHAVANEIHAIAASGSQDLVIWEGRS